MAVRVSNVNINYLEIYILLNISKAFRKCIYWNKHFALIANQGTNLSTSFVSCAAHEAGTNEILN